MARPRITACASPTACPSNSRARNASAVISPNRRAEFARFGPGVHEDERHEGIHVGVFDTARAACGSPSTWATSSNSKSTCASCSPRWSWSAWRSPAWLGWVFAGRALAPVRALSRAVDALPVAPTLDAIPRKRARRRTRPSRTRDRQLPGAPGRGRRAATRVLRRCEPCVAHADRRRAGRRRSAARRTRPGRGEHRATATPRPRRAGTGGTDRTVVRRRASHARAARNDGHRRAPGRKPGAVGREDDASMPSARSTSRAAKPCCSCARSCASTCARPHARRHAQQRSAHRDRDVDATRDTSARRSDAGALSPLLARAADRAGWMLEAEPGRIVLTHTG